MSKLKNYIVYESNVSAYEKGKKITKMIMEKFFKKLEKRQFVYATMDDVVFDLNQVSPKTVRFIVKMGKKNVGRYISGAIFDWDLNHIQIKLTNNLNDYLRRFAREDN